MGTFKLRCIVEEKHELRAHTRPQRGTALGTTMHGGVPTVRQLPSGEEGPPHLQQKATYPIQGLYPGLLRLVKAEAEWMGFPGCGGRGL